LNSAIYKALNDFKLIEIDFIAMIIS